MAASGAVPAADALAVIQARMSSTRLPGKVLADVGGETMLALLLRRLEAPPSVARIVVATSDDESDDPVAEPARGAVRDVHRGSLTDVLARFVGAAEGHGGPIIRITADCPLTDPAVVEAVLERFRIDDRGRCTPPTSRSGPTPTASTSRCSARKRWRSPTRSPTSPRTGST